MKITFAREPKTVYKYTRYLAAFKSSVSSKKPRTDRGNRETAIGRISRGVKHLFSGDYNDRISKRSCHDSVKLVTQDGEAKRLCSHRTASSTQYLSKLMTPLFRQEMTRVQIERKMAKEKLLVEKSLIERNCELIVKKSLRERNCESDPNILKRLFPSSMLSQPKDKARSGPIDVFIPNKKLLEGHDKIYQKKFDLERRERSKNLAARIAEMKASALQKNLATIREMKRNYYDAAVWYSHYDDSSLYWTSDTETEDSDSDDCYIDYDQYMVEKIFPPEMVEVQNMAAHTDPADDNIAFLNYLKIHNRTVMPVPAESSWYISKPVFEELATE